ncbi:unnamed protein product [Angiostrongylus costaricensis]|uniref:CNDH2_N domain-containing protein n=1 Tax=Angiostrongylus costaricensis TaxID=334426 RepID=A0A0R3PI88_ANGCS|nr:unnamed protein product [Angiostrongylus costaricensis]
MLRSDFKEQFLKNDMAEELNFAEAAMLLQGSAFIFARNVGYVHSQGVLLLHLAHELIVDDFASDVFVRLWHPHFPPNEKAKRRTVLHEGRWNINESKTVESETGKILLDPFKVGRKVNFLKETFIKTLMFGDIDNDELNNPIVVESLYGGDFVFGVPGSVTLFIAAVVGCIRLVFFRKKAMRRSYDLYHLQERILS